MGIKVMVFCTSGTDWRFVWYLVVAVSLCSCAQLPQSSVTLSNSIAEDIVSMQAAHKQFVNYYYDHLEAQANDLIDSKYRPDLIRQVIVQDVAAFRDANTRDESLFNAIQVAFIDNEGIDSNELYEIQDGALEGMQIFYTAIDRRAETERMKLLNPLRSQRSELLQRIEQNYTNIIKKNTAITALLNSVISVHETQNQLLEMSGVEQNVRTEAAELLGALAETIDEIQGDVDDTTSVVTEVENAIEDFGIAIRGNPEAEE